MSKKATKERQFRQREQQKKHFNGPMRLFLEVKYPEIYGEYRELYTLLSTNHPHARDLTKTCTFKVWQCSIHRQPATTSRVSNEIISDQNNNSQAMHDTAETTNETANNGSCSSTTARVSNEIISDQNNNSQAIHDTAETTNETANNDSCSSTTARVSNEIIIDQNNNSQAIHDTAETTNETANNDSCSLANEAAPIRVNMDELIDIMVNVEDQVDQIMNELRQDQDLRDILDQPETQPEDEGIDINPLDDIEYDIEPLDFNIEVENYLW